MIFPLVVIRAGNGRGVHVPYHIENDEMIIDLADAKAVVSQIKQEIRNAGKVPSQS